MNSLTAGLCVTLAFLLSPSIRSQERDTRIIQAVSGPRSALVIGNSAYSPEVLKNPINDAREIAKALSELGFNVTLKENLNREEMKRSMVTFGEQLRTSDVGLFYYAGHGFQMKGRNYLKPIGAPTKASQIASGSVDVGFLFSQLASARNKINIVILDACRNNPFPHMVKSIGTGLASIDAPSDTLIAYATAPGKIARDGEAGNGAYTKELLRHIRDKDATVEEVFKRVRISVRDKTRGRQIPWESSSLTYEVYFNQEFTLNGGVLNNKAISKPAPVYPEAAEAAGVAGEVNVLIVYNEEGRVISARAFGSELLREPAEKAAYEAIFPPTRVNGKRIKVRGYLTYYFGNPK